MTQPEFEAFEDGEFVTDKEQQDLDEAREATPPVSLLAAEQIRRRNARDSLVRFALSIDIPGAPAVAGADDDTHALDLIYKPVETQMVIHHRVILEAMQRTMLRPAGRLILVAPPGAAKSTYVSVVSPTWFLGKFPGTKIIMASYASGIANRQSRKARSICSQAAYTSIFPTTLSAERAAVDEWTLTNGSEFMAAGIMGGVTGSRADGVVIDDPIANREEADSPTMQEKLYNEFTDTISTRLKPNGWIVIMATRWNENDLTGSILPDDYDGQSGMVMGKDGQEWEVVHIAAKCEREDDILGRKVGEYLWPEWFPPRHWQTFENNPRAKRTWASLYQGRPAPDSGLQFSRSMFKRYKRDLPEGADGGPPVWSRTRCFGASDYATKDAEEAGKKDFTEHGVAQITHDHRVYFTDWWSGQKQTDVGIKAMMRFLHRVDWRKPRVWFNEGGPIDKAIRPAINREMRDSKAYVRIESMPSIQSKEIKLEAFHALASAGLVYFPENCEWAEAVINQLIAFPAGKHDDKADVCGLIGRGIDKTWAEAPPEPPAERKQLTPFTEAWFTANSEDDDKPSVRYFS